MKQFQYPHASFQQAKLTKQLLEDFPAYVPLTCISFLTSK